MISIIKAIEDAWDNLSKISVTGEDVDRMALARASLRRGYLKAKEIESNAEITASAVQGEQRRESAD